MRLSALAAAAGLAAGLMGCREHGRSAPAAQGADAAAPSVDPTTPAGQVALELWQLREGVSLAEWRTSHGAESVGPPGGDSPAGMMGWCARSSRTFEAGGRAIRRDALFFPPNPTGAGALPADSGDLLLLRGCGLGALVTAIQVAQPADGARLADTLSAELSRIYGPAERDTGPVPLDLALWTYRGRWTRGRETIVVALERGPRTAVRDTVRAGLAALVLGVLSGVAPPNGPDAEADAVADTLPLDRAVQISGVDTALWAPLREALRSAARRHGGSGGSDSAGDFTALLAPLRRWLTAARGLPAGRRAAAMLVADEVLYRSQCAFALCDRADSLHQRQLRALGAAFRYSELGGVWTYTRSWLKDVVALGLDGPVSTAAFLTLLEDGFDTSEECAGGAEQFRTVISRGEAWLKRPGERPQAAAVHFLVGEAYRDIVALGHGAGGSPADSTKYLAEAPAALAKALEHYRAAIAADSTSRAARAAWRQAWWLLAGLPPRPTRFFCLTND